MAYTGIMRIKKSKTIKYIAQKTGLTDRPAISYYGQVLLMQ
jgi:hypothetical protein